MCGPFSATLNNANDEVDVEEITPPRGLRAHLNVGTQTEFGGERKLGCSYENDANRRVMERSKNHRSLDSDDEIQPRPIYDSKSKKKRSTIQPNVMGRNSIGEKIMLTALGRKVKGSEEDSGVQSAIERNVFNTASNTGDSNDSNDDEMSFVATIP